ncbi:MAG: hypothetical protein LUD29_06660 [Clostridia bacterium]|nr:hypothetical protein [Clostridia bacterium]
MSVEGILKAAQMTHFIKDYNKKTAQNQANEGKTEKVASPALYEQIIKTHKRAKNKRRKKANP